jgi:hypothetical protein
MPKLQTPLLSFGASGQINKTLVCYTLRGQNVARSYVIPTNPRTAAQTTQRDKITNAVTFWQRAITDTRVRESWANLLSRDFEPMAGYNKCTQQILHELSTQTDPLFCTRVTATAPGAPFMQAYFASAGPNPIPSEAGPFDCFIGPSISTLVFVAQLGLQPGNYVQQGTSVPVGEHSFWQFRKGTWRSGIIDWIVGSV